MGQIKKKVGITDTTLRDAHQSLLATRMRTEEMLPITTEIDQVGYHSLEMWGGATFDTCMRFLKEDPWERLRLLREHFKKTKLQMLLRGQNLLGYRHYPDDVVEAFVKHAVKNGIDIIRIFDALNDIRNLETAMKAAKKANAHVQAAISYTISPLHNIAHFENMAIELEKKGADSICIKDMAGLISPYDAFVLVQGLKKKLKVPVQLHSHFTSGMATMSYLKAIEAGCDVVDTAISSLSLGSSQPSTDSIVAALKGTPFDTELDLELIARIGDYFKKVRQNYDIPQDLVMGVDTNVLSYQIPGGMISNLTSQLAAQNASHLLKEVLEEVPRVRAELGYPPLVTPSSQIVGTQAVVNVLTGERYKVILTEVKNYLKGLYGQPPGEIDPDLLKKVLGNEQPFKGRPADLLEPQLEKTKEEMKNEITGEEDLLSYILFPQVARAFLKERGKQFSLSASKIAVPQQEPSGNTRKTLGNPASLRLENLHTIDKSLVYNFKEGKREYFTYPSA
ncbi:MAG: oxaloacetate decarboxylase subunit alpha [Firmicutes bacterium]|nr:oxaloacetate decarboxylase subunit alpha [Bacillota bacterium]